MARLDLTVDPKSEYERKLMTPEQAAGLVESGDLIWIPSTHVPPAILAVLATRESELRDVTIRSVSIPNMGWFRADAADAWNLQVQYAIVPDNRQALADRVIDCHPFHMINEHKVRDARVSGVQRYNAEAPDMAQQIVRKALFADRSLRFQSAAEFQKVLEVLARRNGWPMTVEALKPLLGG